MRRAVEPRTFTRTHQQPGDDGDRADRRHQGDARQESAPPAGDGSGSAATERGCEFGRRRESTLRRPGQGPPYCPVDVNGHTEPERGHPRRRLGQLAGDHELRGGVEVGRAAGQHLEEDAAQRVEIAAAVDVDCPAPAPDSCRPGCPIAIARVRQACLAAGMAIARAMPKSATIACPSCSRMFSGLMSRCTTAVGVGIGQRVGHFAGDLQRVVDREPFLRDSIVRAAILAVDERHDVSRGDPRPGPSRTAAGCAGCRRRAVSLDFAEEPLGAEDRGELRPEHLDGDLAVVLEVRRQVDRGHPAVAELALEAVAVGERGGRRSGRGPSRPGGRELCHSIGPHREAARAERTDPRARRESDDDATAGPLRHRLRGHGGAHHDHPAAALLRHRLRGRRHDGRLPDFRLLHRPAGRGPVLGALLRPLRSPPRHPRRTAADRCLLRPLRLCRIDHGASRLPADPGRGGRHDRRGAGLRRRRLSSRRSGPRAWAGSRW